MSSMTCLSAGGPAKSAAGSPGNARVNRNVTLTTPIKLGMASSRRLPMSASMAIPRRLGLDHRAIVETTVEPICEARDVLLHRDVQIGLVQRDTRNVGEGEIDKALHV